MSKPAKVKAVAANIKLIINAGQAKPAPPVGPALGQAGLNIMSFCKDFNAKTADIQARGTCRAVRRDLHTTALRLLCAGGRASPSQADCIHRQELCLCAYTWHSWCS